MFLHFLHITWETLWSSNVAGKPPLEVSEKNHRTKWRLFQHTMFDDTGGCCSFYYYTSIKIPSRAHYSPTNSHCMQNNAYTYIYIYYNYIYIYPLSLWFGKSINLSPIHQSIREFQASTRTLCSFAEASNACCSSSELSAPQALQR